MTDLLLFYYSAKPQNKNRSKQTKENQLSFYYFQFYLFLLYFGSICQGKMQELQKKYERTSRQLTVCTKVSSGWFCWPFLTHIFLVQLSIIVCFGGICFSLEKEKSSATIAQLPRGGCYFSMTHQRPPMIARRLTKFQRVENRSLSREEKPNNRQCDPQPKEGMGKQISA